MSLMTRSGSAGLALVWMLATACGGESKSQNRGADSSGGSGSAELAGRGGSDAGGRGGGTDGSGTAGTGTGGDVAGSAGVGGGAEGGTGPRAVGGAAGQAPAAGTSGTATAGFGGSEPVDVCPPGAPCQGIPCPPSLPESGSACGSTIVMCPYDTCTHDGGGTNLNAVCNGGGWTVLDAGCLKCCNDDADCDGTLCAQSRCISREHEPGCFNDEECAAGELCAGAYVCPCGSPAECKPDRPGECVAKDMGCCATDVDCAAGEVCVLGVCKAVPPDGRCWRDDECEYWCITTSILCPCGQSCADDEQPGQCGFPS
jgi:hypothetical protein